VNVSILSLDQLVLVRIQVRQLEKYLQMAEKVECPALVPGIFDANPQGSLWHYGGVLRKGTNDSAARGEGS
jgi:hypothetical protein